MRLGLCALAVGIMCVARWCSLGLLYWLQYCCFSTSAGCTTLHGSAVQYAVLTTVAQSPLLSSCFCLLPLHLAPCVTGSTACVRAARGWRSGNKIGDAGALQMVKVLKACTQIRCLSLGGEFWVSPITPRQHPPRPPPRVLGMLALSQLVHGLSCGMHPPVRIDLCCVCVSHCV